MIIDMTMKSAENCQEILKEPKTMENIDLVLSGSGVRLGCHYGAILAIKKKYNIVRIAGTSGGAVIAAAHACHHPFEDIWDILVNIDFNKLMCDGKLTSWYRLIKSGGLYKGKVFENFIENRITKGMRLGDVPGLSIIVTNLTDKESLVLSDVRGYGNMKVSEAVRMSMSAPIYWVPKELYINGNKKEIIDGGVSANYYIDLFDNVKRKSLGILLHNKKKRNNKKIINYFRNIIDTMMSVNEKEHIEDAYWSKTIKIDTGDITPFNLDITSKEIDWTIKHGYEKTLNIINNKLKEGV